MHPASAVRSGACSQTARVALAARDDRRSCRADSARPPSSTPVTFAHPPGREVHALPGLERADGSSAADVPVEHEQLARARPFTRHVTADPVAARDVARVAHVRQRQGVRRRRGPATSRAPPSSRSANDSTLRAWRPACSIVPTSVRTMWCRNASASISSISSSPSTRQAQSSRDAACAPRRGGRRERSEVVLADHERRTCVERRRDRSARHGGAPCRPQRRARPAREHAYS